MSSSSSSSAQDEKKPTVRPFLSLTSLFALCCSEISYFSLTPPFPSHFSTYALLLLFGLIWFPGTHHWWWRWIWRVCRRKYVLSSPLPLWTPLVTSLSSLSSLSSMLTYHGLPPHLRSLLPLIPLFVPFLFVAWGENEVEPTDVLWTDNWDDDNVGENFAKVSLTQVDTPSHSDRSFLVNRFLSDPFLHSSPLPFSPYFFPFLQKLQEEVEKAASASSS